MTFFTDLMEAIPAYTGLSPVAFFTIAALLIALYYLVSGFFAAPKLSSYRNVAMEPLPPPVQLGDVSEADLRAYDGTDPSKPLLMAIKGKIYDVSQSRMFYGPGGPYALFAGKDASRALAKMSFEEQDLTGDIEGLGAYELDALNDWEWKFMSKYVKVGQVVNENSKTRDVTVQDGTSVPKESKVVKGVDVDESKNTNEVDADANQVEPSEETAKSE